MPFESDRHQKRSIRTLFTRIASRYDRINRLLSLGQDQRWRWAALSATRVPATGRLLDVATGTGDMAFLAQRRFPDLRVVGTDLTRAMLDRAREKDAARALPLIVSDGLALTFADNTFDAVTSAFMMRNVPDIERAFAEQRRVVRPGGRVVCLEMTWPRRFPMRWLFGLYFNTVPPLLGHLTLGEQEAYRYLPRSVKAFLDPAALADTMVRAGLRNVTWKTLMLGSVMIHVGIK